MDGLLSGSLTTTPGFSAAKETVRNVFAASPELANEYESAVTVGYGIAYLFGVIGVVLFVQILPKLVHADMDEERKKLASVDTGAVKEKISNLIDIDDMGLGAFGLAALIGLIVGNYQNTAYSPGSFRNLLLAYNNRRRVDYVTCFRTFFSYRKNKHYASQKDSGLPQRTWTYDIPDRRRCCRRRKFC